MGASSSNYSPEEVAQLGERIYFEKLQADLEKEHLGEYLVLDVHTGKYVLNEDKLAAIKEAEESLGRNLFYIAQVGSVLRTLMNFKARRHAWKI